MPKLIIPPQRLADYGITLSDVHRRRLEGRGQFPKRVQITGRSHGYVEEEILAYLAAKVAARDGVTA